MQWGDLWIATAHSKVVRRLTSADDLRAFSGAVAIGPDSAELLALAQRDGVWVSTAPMPETVKDVDDAGLVRATVARDKLSIVRYPIVIDAQIACGATDPEELLRNVVQAGLPLARL